ncbi:MAG: tRNA-dihydrouridine synthase [Pseudomonadales bacterium]|nr:tRNA-dihydrouridine synthase [Pseudomonadales bacterium]
MADATNHKPNSDNFWLTINKPIFGLAPMDGITDQPYRHIQKKYGNPDVLYTEFTNVEGVCHGAIILLKDFEYDETQRPIVAQIYGKTPKYFRQVATILCQLGFDGIDINMGCPAKSVDQSGSGAALIKTPELAQEIIKATQQGVEDYLNGIKAKDCEDISKKVAKEIEIRHAKLPKKFRQARNIPVSVKTRIGYSKPEVDQWIPKLLEMKPALIAIHGRTLKQQYSGQADWDEIKKAARLCHQTNTLILGNGDIKDMSNAEEKIRSYEVDGVLIGRLSFGNPFIFQKESEKQNKELLGVKNQNIFEVALDHCRVYEQTYSSDSKYHFMPMRKHLGWYVKSIPNAKIVRADLFKTTNSDEVESVFKKFGLIE